MKDPIWHYRRDLYNALAYISCVWRQRGSDETKQKWSGALENVTAGASPPLTLAGRAVAAV